MSAPGEWHGALRMRFSDGPGGEQDDSRARFYCDLVLSGPKSLCSPVIGFPSANVFSTGTCFRLWKGSAPAW